MKKSKVEKQGRILHLQIIKRSKKNIIIRINNEGEVVVSIPPRAPYKNGEEVVRTNFDVLYNKSREVLDRLEKKKESNTIMVMGKEIEKNAVGELEKYLMEKAKYEFQEILKKYIEISNLKPSKVRIKSLKSAWGICYSNKSITLNLKLIHLKKELIEYVILHELCHLSQMNHSADFWKEVERYMPDYKVRRKLLKSSSYKYVI